MENLPTPGTANMALAFSLVGLRSLGSTWTSQPMYLLMWVQNSLRFLGFSCLTEFYEVARTEPDPLKMKMKVYAALSRQHRPIAEARRVEANDRVPFSTTIRNLLSMAFR